jgi:hypothetical protein
MRVQNAHVLLAALAAVVVMYARDQVVGEARWWNLVMAARLLAVLARYLWQDRPSRR